jgi:5-methyltetrahydropteroyltriglutamate--homocysteine methyltransferase
VARNQPPYRADHVGSLLRSAPVKEARAKHERGEITDGELKAIEDREIEKIIKKQEEIGLKSITDGEFRRGWWHLDFLERLQGCELYVMDHGIQFAGTQTKPKGVRVVDKLGFAGHPMVEHFEFVKAHARRTPKMTIPSPSALHYRSVLFQAISKTAYPDPDQFFADLGQTYRKTVNAFVAAGCRYLQLDEVYLALLCDPEQRRQLRERGEDPEKLPAIYADVINTAIADVPPDMVITMHLCRGNFRSTYIASGGYEPVADTLLNGINVNGYFMEYDTERAGGFEPLRYLPKAKVAVLGLVTSKNGRLEAKDEIKRRIEEAAKFADIDHLCLSPQCGFASTEEGNILTEDEQWAKLAHVVEIAGEVWGTT